MVTVFLVDDHSVFRAGVRAELADKVDIMGDAGTVAEAIRGINETRPDVVLLDVHMPDGGGLAVIQGIEPGPKFLALSVSDAAEDVIALIRAGARGYTYREIGQKLFISIKTVETHASNILRKTQQSNRYQLTRWAASRDLD